MPWSSSTDQSLGPEPLNRCTETSSSYLTGHNMGVCEHSSTPLGTQAMSGRPGFIDHLKV